MKSLRARAVVGGILSALFTIVLGFTGLSSLGIRQSEQSFNDLHQRRHEMVVSVVESYRADPDVLVHRVGERVFDRPYSGQYWQILTPDGQTLASASLAEMHLPPPTDTAENQTDTTEDQTVRTLRMPDGQTVRIIGLWRHFDDGQSWHVQVASSLQTLEESQTLFRRNLLVAFGVVTLIGIIGSLLQVTLVLRPLNVLRRDVARRWQGEDDLDINDYPTEVVPLVTDINTLLERNREMSHRSRRQAADLAHAIKTPSAIVRNELERLLQDGQDVQLSINALDRLDAQLNRSFARIRAGGGHAEIPVVLDVSAALERMVRAFTALASNADRYLCSDIAPDLRARIEQSDLDEIVGNLLDNAMKWSRSRVCVTAKAQDDLILIEVADDGDGIADVDMARVTESGRRLDTAMPGTGLGLAIVKDLIHGYGGVLTLNRSETMGGLSATVTLKASVRARP